MQRNYPVVPAGAIAKAAFAACIVLLCSAMHRPRNDLPAHAGHRR
jgi:hypothetical protein